MKQKRLNKILKNLRKGEVKKKDKWEPINPEILERIEIQRLHAKNILKSKSHEDAYAQILEALLK